MYFLHPPETFFGGAVQCIQKEISVTVSTSYTTRGELGSSEHLRSGIGNGDHGMTEVGQARLSSPSFCAEN